MINYKKICQPFLDKLPERTKDVILRRFALWAGERETLESIGASFGLTRERVRQIEENGIRIIKDAPNYSNLSRIFKEFKDYFKLQGGLKREDILLKSFEGGDNSGNWVFFLLTLEGSFTRYVEKKDTYAFWAENSKIVSETRNIIKEIKKDLEKAKKILTFEELVKISKENKNLLRSALEISREILPASKNSFGLKSWPEVNPKGVKDLAYLVFKKNQKPLHYKNVTSLIDEFLKQKKIEVSPYTIVQASVDLDEDRTNPQTVHNELIRDPRFVLVGRGTYALTEWGYKAGVVKDIISQTIKEAKKPLSKEEIMQKVLAQRIVKENTILLNLHDRDLFLKTDDGKYTIKEI